MELSRLDLGVGSVGGSSRLRASRVPPSMFRATTCELQPRT